VSTIVEFFSTVKEKNSTVWGEMNFLDEFKKLMGYAEDLEVARLLGKDKSTISKWRTNGVPAAAERQLKKILEESGRYLNQDGKRDIGHPDGCQMVDIFNMVEGGPGAEPEWHEPIDRRAIPTGFLKPHIRPVLVRGRSMEPTFKNGAIIGIDQNDKHVIEGEAYAVVLPYSGAAVKRLYPLPDGVLIRSDNKEFPEVKLNRDEVPEFFVLGRVCWVVQEV
jgi:SOS-response transcriptional repressor LexA